jgi:predicted peptidase
MNPHRFGIGLPIVLLLLTSCGGGNKTEPEPAQASQPTTAEPIQLRVTGEGIQPGTVRLADGTIVRYTVSVPHGYKSDQPCPLVVALHYAGGGSPFYGRGMVEALVGPAFADAGAIVIAPDAHGDGPWTTQKNEDIVVWLTKSAMKTYAVDPKRIALTGFSMGGEGTWYIGSRHQDLFSAAIPIAGRPAGSAEWKIPVYVIHSQKDQVVPIGPAEQHVKALKAKGANVEWKVLPDLTHFQTDRYQGALREAAKWWKESWKEKSSR